MKTGLQQKRFSVINEGFVCENCHQKVLPSEKSCRNHCPFCLTSKHLDTTPGDRQSLCMGQMKAFDYEISSKKGIILHFYCLDCGYKNTNKAAYEDPIQADSLDIILACKKHN